MLKDLQSSPSKHVLDANASWLSCKDVTPLDQDVKTFAKFVCLVFDLPVAALDVEKYKRIVEAADFLELLGERAAPEDRARVDFYLAAAPSNLKFYIRHSVLCLAGRLEAANTRAAREKRLVGR